MKIKIISDSTCDLAAQLIEENHITLTPLTVIKNDEQFKDGVTITPADIFAHVAAGGSLCTTAANSIGEYADVFEKYSADYDGIIMITIGSGFSACYQNACLAAEDYPKVRVVDSRNLTTGQGLLVLKACELAKTAEDLDSLAEAIRDLAEKVEASFIVDKLDYLVKGGRCSSAAALGANLLNLKPCIELKDGKMGVGKKYRGNYTKCLVNYIKERLDGRDDIDTNAVFITRTVIDDDAYAAVKEAVQQYGHFDVIHETVAGCTVSCHCGPGTLGILFLRK
ncbi:MAG: DegV family protein [Oscillospiraceae bacterium]|nr:DegV family protein [Oscillospiraceae bacterium]